MKIHTPLLILAGTMTGLVAAQSKTTHANGYTTIRTPERILIIKDGTNLDGGDPFAHDPSISQLGDPFAGSTASKRAEKLWSKGDPPIPANASNVVQDEPQNFHISQVGQKGRLETRDRLIEVFAMVQRNYQMTSGRAAVKPSLVSAQVLHAKISQRVSKTEFLFSDSYVKTLDEHDWVDGQVAALLVSPAELYSYTTVLKAKRSVKGYREAGWEEGISQEDFVSQAKAGKVFVAWRVENRPQKDTGIKLNPKLDVPTLIKYTITW